MFRNEVDQYELAPQALTVTPPGLTPYMRNRTLDARLDKYFDSTAMMKLLAAFENIRLLMRDGKRYTKGVLACEIRTEPIPQVGSNQSMKIMRVGGWERK